MAIQLGEMMKKFLEILFLTNLNRVGKATIYKNYWDLLKENDIDDLVAEMDYKSKFSFSELEKAREKAEKFYDSIINDSNIEVITVFDDNYPQQLNIMGNKKPLLLYVKGNLEALSKPNLAVIGTRKPSNISQAFEVDMVKKVINTSDRVIVSGLALGCDKIAHQTTVDENKMTIAILPSGVNKIKPAKHKELAFEIIDKGGCLVSEYEPYADAQKHTYVQRDQIVAAFSDAIFVVECGVKSGTMHTVNFAEEYGKRLFTYLPVNKQNVLFDGNEFILKNKFNSFLVNDIENFCNDLNHLNFIKCGSKSNKQILKLSKKSGQTTFDFKNF